MSRQVLDSEIRAKMGPMARELLSLIHPSVRIITQPHSVCDLAIGQSRMGGVPDLPEGTVWPSWEYGPLDFLAQLELSAVAPHDAEERLPASGWLLFFWDVMELLVTGRAATDRRSWRVLYIPTTAGELRRSASPFPLNVGSSKSWEHNRRPGGFTCCALSFHSDWTPAPVCSTHLSSFSRETGMTYAQILDQWEEAQSKISGLEEAGKHRLLGHPDPVQSNVELDAYVTATGADRSDFYRHIDEFNAAHPALAWRLLLQLDTDANTNMTWGDAGRVYFMIHGDALARHMFDDVTLVLQCG